LAIKASSSNCCFIQRWRATTAGLNFGLRVLTFFDPTAQLPFLWSLLLNCQPFLGQLSLKSDSELDWIVGGIPIEDGIGKEYISRFTASEIRNNGTFYTDSNGRELLRRQLNHQVTYKVNVTEPTAGNFYPVNSFAYVEDKSTRSRMTVLNDRAQGVSSLLPGSLEFMVVPLPTMI
jgi:hypothetical protein